jgi:hypothetical protein
MMVLQFFEGGHGKTGWLDGTIFGDLGDVLAELQKKERVTTSRQVMEAAKAHYAGIHASRPQKYQDLNKWVWLLWEPTRRDVPKKISVMMQYRMSSYRCWSSKPVRGSFFTQAAVEIRCHALIHDDGKPGVHLKYGVHYDVRKEDNKINDRTRGAETVKVAKEVNTRTIERTLDDVRATLECMSTGNQAPAFHMLLKRKKPAAKRKRSGKEELPDHCDAPVAFSDAQLLNRVQ